MNVILTALTGKYNQIGNPKEADCVIGFSFGAAEQDPGYVNKLLAEYICHRTSPELPLILQNEIADALPKICSRKPALKIEGQPSTISGQGLDSWEVLRRSFGYMKDKNIQRPLLIAQAYHVGRIALQAKKQGMDKMIVPEDLPDKFDPNSIQPWTTNRTKWAKREIIGLPYLKFMLHKL